MSFVKGKVGHTQHPTPAGLLKPQRYEGSLTTTLYIPNCDTSQRPLELSMFHHFRQWNLDEGEVADE